MCDGSVLKKQAGICKLPYKVLKFCTSQDAGFQIKAAGYEVTSMKSFLCMTKTLSGCFPVQLSSI